MAQALIIEDESDHNSTQMPINQYLSLSLSTAWRAGQDPGQRIAQYFLPELRLPLWLSCENACPESLVSAWHQARATTGSHSHLHPPRALLCALTHATPSPPHAHARQAWPVWSAPAAPDWLETNWGRKQGNLEELGGRGESLYKL